MSEVRKYPPTLQCEISERIDEILAKYEVSTGIKFLKKTALAEINAEFEGKDGEIDAGIFSRMKKAGTERNAYVTRLINYFSLAKFEPGFKSEIEAKRVALLGVEQPEIDSRTVYVDQNASSALQTQPSIRLAEIALFTNARTLEIDQTVDDLVLDHEPHDVEPSILKFIGSNESSYVYLTAGPGLGKTAIMASLARHFRDSEALIIPYFFVQEDQQSRENTLRGFYNYLLARLSLEFRKSFEPPNQDLELGSYFERIVCELNSESHISQDRQLVILVDALDEIDILDAERLEKTTPLTLPKRLPSGVHIICSRRQSVSQDKKQLWGRGVSTLRLQLEDSTNFERHASTVRRYVNRICERNKDIRPYQALVATGASGKDKANFINTLCKNAGYNFMILRCALHDPTQWSDENLKLGLTDDLNEYYERHLIRMMGSSSRGPNAAATFCFALRPTISTFAFLHLLGNAQLSRNQIQATQALESWIAQGLILRKLRSGIGWLSAYHRTYRNFLLKQFEQQDRYSFLAPFVDNLCEFVDLNGSLEQIADEPAAVQEEWIELLLYLSVMAEKTVLLRKVLLNFHFWDLAAKSESGIGIVIEHIARVYPTNPTSTAFRSVFEAAASNLNNWIADQRLKHADGSIYTRKHLLDIAVHANPAKRADGAIYFSDFVQLEDSSVNDMSEDDRIRLAKLFEDQKAARYNNDLDKARILLDEIQRILERHSRDRNLSNWARFAYDKGFLLNIEGRFSDAADQFRLSGAYSRQDRDTLGGWIGEFRYALTLYLGDNDSAENTFKTFVEIDRQRNQAPQDAKKNITLWRTSDLNLRKRLCELAFDVGADDLDRWSDYILQHEHMERSKQAPNPVFELIRVQTKARLAIHHGRFDEAACILASYLDVDIPDCNEFNGAWDADAIREYAHGPAEEIARDYRDLGLSLLRSSFANREGFAKKAWERGLEIHHGRGNLRFQREIREHLKALDTN